jgi:hypothetical protein
MVPRSAGNLICSPPLFAICELTVVVVATIARVASSTRAGCSFLGMESLRRAGLMSWNMEWLRIPFGKRHTNERSVMCFGLDSRWQVRGRDVSRTGLSGIGVCI